MLKMTAVALTALCVATGSAYACCGGDKAATGDGKMQCMKMMDSARIQGPSQSQAAQPADPHAGMDMGKNGTMDRPKTVGCCCGCCGGDKKEG